MAVKRCPSCEQSLPVACKSCPCGHIFITKKANSSKESEGNKNEEPIPLKRLRPERPKREIPDYEYCDDYTRISMNGNSHVKSISKRLKLFEDVDEDDEDDEEEEEEEDTTSTALLCVKDFERLDSNEESIGQGKKKRGRPKGSKNKPKDMLDYNNVDSDQSSQSSCSLVRKPGRPKGPKSKTADGLVKAKSKSNVLPPIPPEKVVVYSLILTDINEKLMSQNKMKCLPGF